MKFIHSVRPKQTNIDDEYVVNLHVCMYFVAIMKATWKVINTGATREALQWIRDIYFDTGFHDFVNVYLLYRAFGTLGP